MIKVRRFMLLRIWMVLYVISYTVECYTLSQLGAYAKANLNISTEVIHKISEPSIFGGSETEIRNISDSTFHILFQINKYATIIATILATPAILIFLLCSWLITIGMWIVHIISQNSWFLLLVFISSFIILCLEEDSILDEPIVMQQVVTL